MTEWPDIQMPVVSARVELHSVHEPQHGFENPAVKYSNKER